MQRSVHILFAVAGCVIADLRSASGQTNAVSEQSYWLRSAFIDAARLSDFNSPSNHLFRNRGTTPRVDEWDLNMAGASLKKIASERSRWGVEATVHGGQDSRTFGFSATARNADGANWLLHLGPVNASYIAPVGEGLTVQAGIFNSLIGYDSLYAKDNFTYTRPWGADYTPYLMLGVSATYPFTGRSTAAVAVTNGYWHLARANGAPSVTGQIAHKLTDRVTAKQTVLVGPHQSNTAFEFWRWLSDTIVERRGDRFIASCEWQLAVERVDVRGHPRALWASAQLPLHWLLPRRISVTVRPELAWDRDGRWIAGRLEAGQSVAAITSTIEQRIVHHAAAAIVRLEHRFDRARGAGGGFFVDGPSPAGGMALTPRQHLLVLALILTLDSSAER
jgi:hypothetical protein